MPALVEFGLLASPDVLSETGFGSDVLDVFLRGSVSNWLLVCPGFAESVRLFV